MKTQYRKYVGYYDEPGQYSYCLRNGGYHRSVRTFPELRERAGVEADEELREYGVQPRLGRNHNMLDPWNDFAIRRNHGRSWKDYTKHRKQWMRANDPAPSENHSRFIDRLMALIAALEADSDAR